MPSSYFRLKPQHSEENTHKLPAQSHLTHSACAHVLCGPSYSCELLLPFQARLSPREPDPVPPHLLKVTTVAIFSFLNFHWTAGSFPSLVYRLVVIPLVSKIMLVM